MARRSPTAPDAFAYLRVLLCKSGLDEHDRGVRYVMRKLRDAGMEVIYLVFHDPGEIAAAAVQEDVAVIGLSSFAGGHIAAVTRIRDDFHAAGAPLPPLVLGGIIPDADRAHVAELGVVGVFGPGSDPADIIETIRNSAGLA